MAQLAAPPELLAWAADERFFDIRAWTSGAI
jgi:hypothetical protein